jgi:hypothetical protein
MALFVPVKLRRNGGLDMRSLIGLVIVLLIVFASYKLYFSQLQSATGSVAPARTMDVIGVQNDLVAIAQAERIYLAQHSSYGSLGDLVSSGAMALSKTGRDGYTYEAETSGTGFRVVAHCPAATSPGCTNFSIDDTMEVHASP